MKPTVLLLGMSLLLRAHPVGLVASLLVLVPTRASGEVIEGSDTSLLFDNNEATDSRSVVTFEPRGCFSRLSLQATGDPLRSLQRVWIHQMQANGAWGLLANIEFGCETPVPASYTVPVTGEACEGTVRVVLLSCSSDPPALKGITVNQVMSKTKRSVLETEQVSCSSNAQCADQIIYTRCSGGTCVLPTCYTHADCVNPALPMCNFDTLNPICALGCTSHDDCIHIPGYPYCDSMGTVTGTAGICHRVECILDNDCPDASVPVCNKNTALCSAECTSHDDCVVHGYNFFCVQDTEDSDVGTCIQPQCWLPQWGGQLNFLCSDYSVCQPESEVTSPTDNTPYCQDCETDSECAAQYPDRPWCDSEDFFGNGYVCLPFPCRHHDDCVDPESNDPRQNPKCDIDNSWTCGSCDDNSQCSDKYAFHIQCDSEGGCIIPECTENDDCDFDPEISKCDPETWTCTDCEVDQDCEHLLPDELIPWVCNQGDCIPGCYEDEDCLDPDFGKCDRTPNPDADHGQCVGCDNQQHCAHFFPQKSCDPETNRCVLECWDDDDCIYDDSEAKCYRSDTENYCTECDSHDNCAHIFGSFCDDGTCKPPECLLDEDCLYTPDEPVCVYSTFGTVPPQCLDQCDEQIDCTKYLLETDCRVDGKCVEPDCRRDDDCNDDPLEPVCVRDTETHVRECVRGCTSDDDCAKFQGQLSCVISGDLGGGYQSGTCAPVCTTGRTTDCSCLEDEDCLNPSFPYCSLTAAVNFGSDALLRQCTVECYKSPKDTRCAQFADAVWCVTYDVAGAGTTVDSYGQCIVPECLVDEDCTRPGFPFCDVNFQGIPAGPRCVRSCASAPAHNQCAQFSQHTYCATTGACVIPDCHTSLDCLTPNRPHCNLMHSSGKPTCTPACINHDECAQFILQYWCDTEATSDTHGQCIAPACLPYGRHADLPAIVTPNGISVLCTDYRLPVCDTSTGKPTCVATCTTDDDCVQFVHETRCSAFANNGDGTCVDACEYNRDCLVTTSPVCTLVPNAPFATCEPGCVDNYDCAQFGINFYCDTTQSGICVEPECITNRECPNTKPVCLHYAGAVAPPTCQNVCDDDNDCSQYVWETACDSEGGYCYEPDCMENQDCKDRLLPTCNTCTLVNSNLICRDDTKARNTCINDCTNDDECSHFSQWESCDADTGICTIVAASGTGCFEYDDCTDPARPWCPPRPAGSPSGALCIQGCTLHRHCERFLHTLSPLDRFGYIACEGGECVQPECLNTNDCTDPTKPVCVYPTPNIGKPVCQAACTSHDQCAHFEHDTLCVGGQCVTTLCDEDDDCPLPSKPTCLNKGSATLPRSCTNLCDSNEDCARFSAETWCVKAGDSRVGQCIIPPCLNNWHCLDPRAPVCDLTGPVPECRNICTANQDCVQFAQIEGNLTNKYGHSWCLNNGQCGQPLCLENRDCYDPLVPVCDMAADPPSCDNLCMTDDDCSQYTREIICLHTTTHSCFDPECTSNWDCPSAKPTCDLSLNPPVCTADCTNDDDCAQYIEEIICSLTSHTCVRAKCTENDDCPNTFPVCDLTLNPPDCAAICESNDDCTQYEETIECSDITHLCKVPGECHFDKDCSGFPARPACWTGNSQCVGCTLDLHCAGTPATPACNVHDHVCVPCNDDEDCTTTLLPACATADHRCAECVDDRDCTVANPNVRPNERTCDSSVNECVECLADDDCPAVNPSLHACIKAKRTCVPCTSNVHCTDPLLPACDFNSNTCQECVSNNDCSEQPLRKTCDSSHGACIRCLVDSDCSIPSSNALRACNAATRDCVACTLDAHCTAAGMPACDLATNMCVECTGDIHCPAAGCDLSRHQCLQCTTDGDCAAYPGTPACDVASGSCVACLSSAHCTSPLAPACDTGSLTCVQCSLDAHCSGSTPACSVATKTCVACTTNTHCKVGVCDITDNTCSDCVADSDCPVEMPVCNTAAGECVGCLSDSQCDQTVPVCDQSTSSCVECTCWLRNQATPICKDSKCSPCTDDSECVANFLYYQACATDEGICVADSYKKGFYISAVVLGSVAIFLVSGALIAIVAGAAAK